MSSTSIAKQIYELGKLLYSGELVELSKQVEALEAENKRLKQFIYNIFVECLNDFGDPFEDNEIHERTMLHCYNRLNHFAENQPDWGKWDFDQEAYERGFNEGRTEIEAENKALRQQREGTIARLDMPTQQLLLHIGELTKNEIRVAKAVLGLATSILREEGK